MGVRFIIGRAGTGKTRHCFDSIVTAMRAEPFGSAIYWLLPKQATFSAERDLVTRSGLEAFCRARILSFELLGEEVLASCGGAAVPAISSIGRQMLLGHLLRSRQNDLKFFNGVAKQPGLAARLDSTFAEFERCGKDPAAIAELIDQLVPAPGDSRGKDPDSDELGTSLLRNKLTDFHLLFKAYRDALGQERVDPHRRLEQVLSCIADHKPLRGASVFIDGFLEFTDRERRMILALGKTCESVDISLLIDPASETIQNLHHIPDDLSLFHRTESQYRLLALALQDAGVRLNPPMVLKEPERFVDPALKAIERDLFANTIEPQPSAEMIELVEAPDRRTEVDAAARRIRAAVSAGRRYRDIAVLVRDIDQYEELLSTSFHEHDIPYFVDRRKSAAHHPLLQFTRAALQVARQNWSHEAVISILKSGLASVSPMEADDLENYVLLHRIHGTAWADKQPWTYSRTVTRRHEDEDARAAEERESTQRIDAIRRRLAGGLTPFINRLQTGQPQPLRQLVVAIFDLHAYFNVRETLAGWIERATADNDLEQRGEHEQVWQELIELFDQMVDLLGDKSVHLADFMEILDVGLEQFDLALPPPRVDQVLVGQIDRTRTTTPDTVILLGLSEGQFPKIAREDSVLSDSERRSLRSRNLDIDPDSERRMLDERLFGYLAFTRASHRLIVTRPTAEESKPVHPSSFWLQLQRMLPDNRPTVEKREADALPEAIGTPRQLVTALMRWARSTDPKADTQQPWAGLYQFLAEHPTHDDPIGQMRYKAWRAVGYRNDSMLSPELARKLASDKLRASVTRIETFASCPFKHFARYGLGLSAREEEDVTPMDLGNVYHGILERIVMKVIRDRADWCALEPNATQEMIAKYAAEIGQSLRGELMLGSARNQYLLKRIEKTLERVCATQQATLFHGSFRPAHAELAFGDGAALPPFVLHTPKGRDVLLIGKIDRVDRILDAAEFSVTDYKMSETRLQLDHVYHGLSLQLLTYLLVLQAHGETLFGKKMAPVAAFYSKLLRGLKAIKHPDDAMDAADPEFNLQTKPRGIFDAGYVQELDATLESGVSKVVQVYIKKDGTIGAPNASDAADSATFAALLRFVENKIGELTDRLIDGDIAVRPYRMGQVTPCPQCDYRSVCRFDPGINRYLQLESMSRSDALTKIGAEKQKCGGNDGD